MNIAEITALLRIAELALDLHKADEKVRSTRHAYHEAWRMFECGDGSPDWIPLDDQIRQGHAKWFDALDATKVQHNAYKLARKEAYNAKRRLSHACGKV